MTNFLKYFKQDQKREIFTGDVVRQLGVGSYEVSQGNRTLVCRSTEDLTMGSSVLITRAESHYVVLRKSGQRSLDRVQVTVNG